jgi:hypothetical protein
MIFIYNQILFEPIPLLVIITYLYFLMGGINWIDRGAFVEYTNELYVSIYIFVLFLFINIGAIFVSKKKKKSYKINNIFF